MSSHTTVRNDANQAPSAQTSDGQEIELLTAPQPLLPTLDLLSKETRKKYLKFCVPLYQAALKGDWEAAKGIHEVFPDVIRARITRQWETALHIAAAAKRTSFVKELVKLMTVEDLALQNNIGNTALCFAATSGIVENARVMVERNEDLPMIRGSKGMTPLYMAALLGHSDMVWYLYSVTSDNKLTEEDRIGLLVITISNDLYDIALDILKKHPKLAVARDKNEETALHVLARKTEAYTNGGEQLEMWRKRNFSCVGLIHNDKLKHNQVIQLVKFIWSEVVQLDDSEIADLIRVPSRLVFVAAASGNIDFIAILLRSYPDLIWKIDHHGKSIFHVAVEYRQEAIFNLIYEIGAIKDLIATYIDDNDNNMLHLAAKIAPPRRLNIVSGAALQFHRELLWFKEVEKIVPRSYSESRNKQGKSPRALFLSEHKELMKQGEEWMMNTANSCMLVATLIATVMFAAAFTVPGGNKDNGAPMYLKKNSFLIFAISDAISLFSSTTSILMFLSILTSRYAENDFVKSLPSRLMFGLATLFLSIATMMIAFCATFFIVFDHGFLVVAIPVASIACLPVTLYALLQYPLFGDIISSTYKSRYLFQSKKHMLY